MNRIVPFLIALFALVSAGVFVAVSDSDDSFADLGGILTVQQGQVGNFTLASGVNTDVVMEPFEVHLQKNNVDVDGSFWSSSFSSGFSTVILVTQSSLPVGDYVLKITGIHKQNHQMLTLKSYALRVIGEEDLGFTNPDSFDAVAGSSFSYSMTVNIPGTTFSKVGGNASFLDVSGTVLSGTIPNVSSKTTYTCEVKATSPGGQTSIQTITFVVYPKLTASGVTIYYTVGTAPITVPQFSHNLSVTAPAKDQLGVRVAGDGTLSVPSTLTTATDSTFTVRLTSAEGPAQYKDVQVRVVVTPVLTLDVVSTGSYLTAGSAYSQSVTVSVPSADLSLVSAPSWIVLSGKDLIVSVPGSISEPTDYSFKVKAAVAADSSHLAQTKEFSVVYHVEPVLQWTSIPVAAMMIVPVDVHIATGGAVLGASISDHMAAVLNPYDTLTFQFIFVGSDAKSVHWDFGDGTSSDEWSPTHTYAKEGHYTVTCTATNTEGTSSVDAVLVASGRLVAAEDWLSDNGAVLAGVLVVFFLVSMFLLSRRSKVFMRRSRL